MPRSIIVNEGRTYIVSPDDPVPPERRLRAFVAGQARDNVTQQPLLVPVQVSVEEPEFIIQVKADNWFVVAGFVHWHFPGLSMASAQLHLDLSAVGYVPKALTVTIPSPSAGQMPSMIVLPSADTEMQRQP